MRSPLGFIALLSLLGLSVGCWQSTPPDGKLSVSGTITWNGKPLRSGLLTLYSEKGEIDAADIHNGRFTIRTKAGEKSVSITAETEIGRPPATPRNPHPVPVKFQYLPRQWNIDSQHKQSITEQTTSLTFAMTGEELMPPSDLLKPQPE